jgi:hypothetical protein
MWIEARIQFVIYQVEVQKFMEEHIIGSTGLVTCDIYGAAITQIFL